MDNSTKVYRMKLKTYRRIRQSFKCKYGETIAEYFERLSKHLEGDKVINAQTPSSDSLLEAIGGTRWS